MIPDVKIRKFILDMPLSHRKTCSRLVLKRSNHQFKCPHYVLCSIHGSIGIQIECIFTGNMKKGERGFTLIETMISLMIISLLIILIAKIVTFSFDMNKKSSIRFKVMQKFENLKNNLLSKPFDSKDLKEGNFRKYEGKLIIHWSIKNITQTLKKIKLSVVYKTIKKQTFFYKSQFM